MTKAQEKVLEIGKYIQKKDGKITMIELLDECAKLPNIRFGARQIFRKGIPLIFSGIPFLFQLS